MPSVVTFDTLSYVKRLKSAGVPEAQVEIQAEALKEIINSDLVTKRDLVEAKVEIIFNYPPPRLCSPWGSNLWPPGSLLQDIEKAPLPQ